MTSSTPTLTTDAPVFNQRRILLFWLPLAASWLLMSTEMPFANAMIARLGEAERMIAAFGIVASLSITIESPVIMLLATSTALARARQNYLQLRRFTLHLMALTTILHILVGWTPLFDLVVRDLMGVPVALLEPVRLGMRIMIFWSAAIGWRRFTQGVMIRYGQTKSVGQGTLVRLAASAGTALLLALWHTPGVAVGAYALSVGVVVEAAYAHWAAGKLIEEKFGVNAPASTSPDLSYGELVQYHTPLAASTLLFLFTQPLISAALARLPNPELVLAAWPVTSGMLFLTRSPVLALPEVIIALQDEPNSHAPLRRFSLRIGWACVAVLALISFTPLSNFYFHTLIGVSSDISRLAVTGGQIGVIIPVVMASQSWFRGLLMGRKITRPVTTSMAANLATMAVVLVGGVILKMPGVALAALAFTLAAGVETVILWSAVRKLHA